MLPECYACAARQALSAARLVTDEEDFHLLCLSEADRMIAEADPNETPPELGERIYRMVRLMAGGGDPFAWQKQRQNQVVEELVPWLHATVNKAGDPLLMATRLSIAGNVVDPGAQESFDLEKSVMEAVGEEGELGEYPALRDRLARARTVLFIADNCGEIVFDRVLIETILSLYDVEVILAVREGPIINDVTIVEAGQLGLHGLCRVISSGMEMPGTVLHRATEEFRGIFDGADVVISKGQGNWETLEDSDREVFFLFQAKCPAVAEVNGCGLGRSLLVRSPGIS